MQLAREVEDADLQPVHAGVEAVVGADAQPVQLLAAQVGAAGGQPGQVVAAQAADGQRRAGQPIAADANLTVHSDGTLPFGWHSAPLGPAGEPIRRFPLVVDGVAAELGLDRRAAALRGRLPNGGVRGLVIPPGTDDEATLRADAVVLDALDWLEVEPTTGWFRAGVGGATLRGDAIDLLGRARTSATVWSTPTYRGPALWHLGPVAVD